MISTTRQRHFAAVFVGLISMSAVTGVLASQTESTVRTVAQNCPNSMTEGIWSAGCLPGVDPPADAVDNRGPDQLPTVRGIPCSSDCLDINRVLPDVDVSQPDTDVRSNP